MGIQITNQLEEWPITFHGTEIIFVNNNFYKSYA